MKSFDSENLNVVYSDNHVLVTIKPAGCLTQPDDTGRQSLEVVAKEWVKRKFNKPGDVFLHCIHRIDRPVWGLVIFARTSKALSRLNESSRDNLIQRLYTAEVEGALPQKEGTLEHYLIHGDHRALVGKQTDPEAKKALLNYRTLKSSKQSTLVSIELKTGRYHQIRAQFSATKHPIIGDGKYGAKHKDEKIHLACTDLSFPHPVTKEQIILHYTAPFI
jgi:23S rRNA pseudouridine1911/1915/1917 synthase